MSDDTSSLSRYLAHAGVCSRRKAVDMIKDGLVLVNNTEVTEPGYKLKKSDVVKVNGKIIRLEKFVYILLNKPQGVVATRSDEKSRRTVIDLLGKEIKQRVYPVGRLDYNTTGLLLLTNDGELTQRLAHPKYKIQKIYSVSLNRPLHPKDVELIKKGVHLTDGIVRVDDVEIPTQSKIKNNVRVTLHSGKHRVVRRLFEKLGYFISKLDRVKFAGMTKKGLQVGKWRFLTDKEVARLKKVDIK
jgi:23S rRNA pseudouridine2605 synthase